MPDQNAAKDAQRISVRDANQGFSRLIAEVDEKGARFIVTKNNREVARIEPIVDAERAAELARREAAWLRLKAQLEAGWTSKDGWTYKGRRDALHDRSDD